MRILIETITGRKGYKSFNTENELVTFLSENENKISSIMEADLPYMDSPVKIDAPSQSTGWDEIDSKPIKDMAKEKKQADAKSLPLNNEGNSDSKGMASSATTKDSQSSSKAPSCFDTKYDSSKMFNKEFKADDCETKDSCEKSEPKDDSKSEKKEEDEKINEVASGPELTVQNKVLRYKQGEWIQYNNEIELEVGDVLKFDKATVHPDSLIEPYILIYTINKIDGTTIFYNVEKWSENYENFLSTAMERTTDKNKFNHCELLIEDTNTLNEGPLGSKPTKNPIKAYKNWKKHKFTGNDIFHKELEEMGITPWGMRSKIEKYISDKLDVTVKFPEDARIIGTNGFSFDSTTARDRVGKLAFTLNPLDFNYQFITVNKYQYNLKPRFYELIKLTRYIKTNDTIPPIDQLVPYVGEILIKHCVGPIVERMRNRIQSNSEAPNLDEGFSDTMKKAGKYAKNTLGAVATAGALMASNPSMADDLNNYEAEIVEVLPSGEVVDSYGHTWNQEEWEMIQNGQDPFADGAQKPFSDSNEGVPGFDYDELERRNKIGESAQCSICQEMFSHDVLKEDKSYGCVCETCINDIGVEQFNFIMEDFENADSLQPEMTDSERDEIEQDVENEIQTNPNKKVSFEVDETTSESDMEFVGIDDSNPEEKKYIVRDPVNNSIRIGDASQIKVQQN